MLRLLTFCAVLLPAGMAGVAPRASDEILSALQTRLETGAGFEDLIGMLGDLEPAELNRLQADYDKVWPSLRDDYLSAFRDAAQKQNSGALRQEKKKNIRAMRDAFHTVRGLPEGPMKGALGARSWPAVEKLRELLLPSAARILQGAGDALKTKRDQLFKLGTFRDGILKAAIAVEEPESVRNIVIAETRIAEEFSDLDRNGLRVMANNRKTAESAKVPESERIGIEDLNLMRLLVGLPALHLDPRLCAASRGHSEDMSRMGFFSHSSPIPGKSSPSDRARLAGTSGGAENIYVGSNNPKSANKGWFYSPGHHRNMFNAGHRRVGLGNSGRHWTQLFGN